MSLLMVLFTLHRGLHKIERYKSKCLYEFEMLTKTQEKKHVQSDTEKTPYLGLWVASTEGLEEYSMEALVISFFDRALFF